MHRPAQNGAVPCYGVMHAVDRMQGKRSWDVHNTQRVVAHDLFNRIKQVAWMKRTDLLTGACLVEPIF